MKIVEGTTGVWLQMPDGGQVVAQQSADGRYFDEHGQPIAIAFDADHKPIRITLMPPPPPPAEDDSTAEGTGS